MSMSQKRGQITPIGVRAREDNGRVLYDPFDGYHRGAGKKRRGEKDIRATVVYGCSDEELFDLRILAASSVRSVQYPRMAEWITRSFATTVWADKGLSVAQAFSTVINDRETSRTLNEHELDQLKIWVREKCAKWGRSIYTTYHILETVASADPELVRQVRISSGGKDRTGKITPTRLQAVVNRFPGEDFHPAQRAILGQVVAQRLTAEETTILVHSLSGLIHPGMTELVVTQIMEDLEIFKASPSGILGQTLVFEEADDLGFEFDGEPTVDDLANLDQELTSNGRGLAVSPLSSKKFGVSKLTKSDKAFANMFGAGPEKGRRNLTMNRSLDDVHVLVARVLDLEAALLAANSNNGNHDGKWWETAVYLTPEERKVALGLLSHGYDLSSVAQDIGEPVNRAIALFQSAFAKRRLLEDQ